MCSFAPLVVSGAADPLPSFLRGKTPLFAEGISSSEISAYRKYLILPQSHSTYDGVIKLKRRLSPTIQRGKMQGSGACDFRIRLPLKTAPNRYEWTASLLLFRCSLLTPFTAYTLPCLGIQNALQKEYLDEKPLRVRPQTFALLQQGTLGASPTNRISSISPTN